MKLKCILKECPNKYADIEITSLAFDSRNVKRGALFFCLDGQKNDGHLYAADAIMSGSVAIVVTRFLDINIPQILVDDTRRALSLAAVAFYSHPSKHMMLLGITGTNGKTTTSYILKSILEEMGENVGLIGTNAIIYNGVQYPSRLTTPDPVELNYTLELMLLGGVTAVVMEVSAHAIELKKIDGLHFDVVGFTNLSRDHLDYFETMENYASAKTKLFAPYYACNAVVNVDDKRGRDIIEKTNLPTITYGALNPSDAFAIDLTMTSDGIKYIMNIEDNIAEINFSIPGRYNMYNTLCAATMAKVVGASMREIVCGIERMKRVDGRFNVIHSACGYIIIDFAHTDDGLKNILTTIREFATKKIITVFGCGGDRDTSKRAIMGQVACELSDYCVVTSDNPRSENPEKIISDIEVGIKAACKNNYTCIVERKKAIQFALSIAECGDIILVAGKGAEKYQEVGNEKIPYNDEQFIRELLERKM